MSNKKTEFDLLLERIKYKTDYIISETPRYRPVIDEDYGDDDQVPQKPINEAPPVATSGKTPTIAPPVPEEPAAVDANTGQEFPIDQTQTPNEIPMDNVLEPLEKPVDEVQNDIIKHNIAATHKIIDQLEELDGYVQGLNGKLDNLTAEVEEVKEPLPVEKLISRKKDSFPFYLGLNDKWLGNYFGMTSPDQDNYDEVEGHQGIRKLPDGTYIADFEDLGDLSNGDIKGSFNKIN